MSDAPSVLIRLIVDPTGACAVLATRARHEAALSADIQGVGRVVAAAGLRLVGLSIATGSATASSDPRPLLSSETLADAVRRVLRERPALEAAT